MAKRHPPFDISRIVYPDEIPIYTHLAKHDWIKYDDTLEGVEPQRFSAVWPSWTTDLGSRGVTIERYKEFCYRHSPQSDRFMFVAPCLRAKTMELLVADGLKTMRPTAEACRAMAESTVNLRFQDYRQPYPGFLIEIPKEFRTDLVSHFPRCNNIPDLVYVGHTPDFLVIETTCTTSNRAITHLFHLAQEGTMQDTIGLGERTTAKIKAEYDFGHLFADADSRRVAYILVGIAVNLSLLMINRNATLEPADPEAWEDSLRRMKTGSRVERTKAQIENASETRVICFDNTVKFVPGEFQVKTDGPVESTGRTQGFHERKGHERRQRYGPNRQYVKIVFIEKYVVHPELYDGPPEDKRKSYDIDIPPEPKPEPKPKPEPDSTPEEPPPPV